jgi:hypothetical protein
VIPPADVACGLILVALFAMLVMLRSSFDKVYYKY